jgi:hypothetical protein
VKNRLAPVLVAVILGIAALAFLAGASFVVWVSSPP